MDVAKEVVQGILDLMAPQDSVGIVLFSNDACAPLQLSPMRCIDIASVKKQARACHRPWGACRACAMGPGCTRPSTMITQAWQLQRLLNCVRRKTRWVCLSVLPVLQFDRDVTATSSTNLAAGLELGAPLGLAADPALALPSALPHAPAAMPALAPAGYASA